MFAGFESVKKLSQTSSAYRQADGLDSFTSNTRQQYGHVNSWSPGVTNGGSGNSNLESCIIETDLLSDTLEGSGLSLNRASLKAVAVVCDCCILLLAAAEGARLVAPGPVRCSMSSFIVD